MTTCTVNAGSVSPFSKTIYDGKAELEAQVEVEPTLGEPNADYGVFNVLTTGPDLVIVAVEPRGEGNPQFSVELKGEYRIHTLVVATNDQNENYVDLSQVELGKTTAAELLEAIGEKCAALDATGARFCVKELYVKDPCHSVHKHHLHPYTGHHYPVLHDDGCHYQSYCLPRPCPSENGEAEV